MFAAGGNVFMSSVDDGTADGGGGVDGEIVVLRDCKLVQFPLVDDALVDCVWHGFLDEFAAERGSWLC